MLRVNELIGFGVGRQLGKSVVSLVSSTFNPATLTSYSFPAQAIGAADATRRVICCLQLCRASTGLTLTSVTIGGVGMTVVATGRHDTGAITSLAAIAIATVAAGTTADIVVNASLSCSSCSIALVRALMSGTSPFDTATGTGVPFVTGACSVPADGFLLAAASSFSNSGVSFAWGGGPAEILDQSPEPATAFGLALMQSAPAIPDIPVRVTSEGAPTAMGLAVASWGGSPGLLMAELRDRMEDRLAEGKPA